MMEFFNLAFDPNIVQIALLVIFLTAALIALRFILRLARRIVALGCAAILILGVVLFVSQAVK